MASGFRRSSRVPRVTPTRLDACKRVQTSFPLTVPAEQLLIKSSNLPQLTPAFVEKLQPKVPHSVGEQIGNNLRPALRHCVEKRIPTADVGLERMLDLQAVAELDVVCVARTAAVGLVGARGKDRAEDAVLHVKHGHVLVDDDFQRGQIQARRRNAAHQVEQLLAIEIVRRCDASGSPLAEKAGGQFAGAVERKIGDDGDLPLGVKRQPARFRTRIPLASCFRSARKMPTSSGF